MSQALPANLLSHPHAFGWRMGSDLHLAWGSEESASGASFGLSFRGFHHPETMKPEIWNFPPLGFCAPEHSLSLAAPPTGRLSALSLGENQNFPDAAGWQTYCARIEGALEEGRLRKIVPARRSSYSLSPDSRVRLGAELLPRILGGEPDGTFRFFFKWKEQIFFGATPELLFRLQENTWLVPAIAGTRAPRTPEEIPALEAELLVDAKERNEHELVVRGIKETLSALGLSPTAPAQPQILRLRGLLHLYTPVTAPNRGLTSEQLRDALHPTAAVGGYPLRPAKNFLRWHEPWNRGLFASPLLFRRPGEEVCLVGIRSGLLSGDSLHLFAGAGYVQGSSAQSEWLETQKKMDFLRRLLEEELR
jgi:isochorismate synthase EntC